MVLPHKHEETVPLHCCLCCPGAACRVRMPTGCVSVLLDSPEPRSVKQALPAPPCQGSPAAVQAGPGPDLSTAVAGGARAMLTALGPSFIKAGQVLASRPDIVREDYMNELCTLQDDVPCFPDAEARCCGGATGAARCWLDAPGGRVGRGGPSCRKRL